MCRRIKDINPFRAHQDWVDLKAGWKLALQNKLTHCTVAQASCLQY
jgi:hypothetical protein